MSLTQELELARRLAVEGGEIALGRRGPALEIGYKQGQEPVTAADRAVSAHIVAALAAAFPGDAILSEELPDDGDRLGKARVWMVDPIDGTCEYIDGGEDFAVMIGLCQDGVPCLGAICLPVTATLYHASRGQGAFVEHAGRRQRLAVSAVASARGARLVASRSHRDSRLDLLRARLGISDELNLGSVGVKVALLCSGERDLYVHPSPRSKLWDTCAPDALLAEAGGHLTDLGGQPLDYAGGELANARGVLASNGLIHDQVVGVLAAVLGPLT